MPDAQLGTLWVDIIARDHAFTQQLTKIGSKMTAIGLALTKNVSLPIAAIGAIGYKSAAEIGKGYMLVARRLGYTGKALDRLMVRFRKIWRNVPEDSEVVAGVLINVEQRFNLTGKAASRMTKKMLDFARIMGADPVTTSRELGMWFQQNEIKAKDQAEAMDMLAYASQKSGVPLDQLITLLKQNSTNLKTLGFNTKEQIALFASFEEAGLGAEDTAQALRMAVASASEEGFKTGEAGLKSFIKEIKGAPNKMEATKRSIEIFGRLAGPKLAAAIRDGTFSVDEWTKKLDGSQGTIKKTTEDTEALSERMKMLGKKILGLFEPIGKIFIYAFEDLILPVLERAANYTDKWADSMDKIPRPVLAAIGTVLTLIALVGPLTAILGWLGNFAVLKYAKIAGGIASIYEFVFLKTAALSYATGLGMGLSFGLILVIIAAVGAAIYIIIKHWDKFVKVFKPVMGSLDELWKTLKKTFGELWTILKPLLLPALKKLAIIVGVIILGAFAGLVIVLIIVINIIVAVIKVFVGLGRVIYGVAQVVAGFFSGNKAQMDAGVKNIKGGAKDIGDAMTALVMDTGKQIFDVVKGVAEGTTAMMDDTNKETAKKGGEGGKAAGKAYEDMSAEEHKTGNKKERSKQDKRDKKKTKKAGKGGKKAGKAYRKNFNEEVQKKGLGRALKDKGRKEQRKQEIKDEKAHQKFLTWLFNKGHKDRKIPKKGPGKAEVDEGRKEQKRQEIKDEKAHQSFLNWLFNKGHKDREEQEKAHLGTIGQFLREANKSYIEEVGSGHMGMVERIASVQGYLIGYLSTVPIKQAQALQTNAQSLVDALKPTWNRVVRATKRTMVNLGNWLRGIPEWYRSVITSSSHFIDTMFDSSSKSAVLGFKNVLRFFSTNWLSKVAMWFKNTITSKAHQLWLAGVKLGRTFIKGMKGGIDVNIAGFGTKIVNAIKRRLGINSPSSVFQGVGVSLRQGLLIGINTDRIREILRSHFSAMVNEDSDIVKLLPIRIKAIFRNFHKWLATVPLQQRNALLSQKAQHIQSALVPVFRKLRKNCIRQMDLLGDWLKGWPKHAANLLKSNASYMADAGKVLATKLINAVKERLGIKSPSKEFNNIGKQMIAGLLKGLSFKQVMAIMSSNFGGMRNFAQNLFDFMSEHKDWNFLDKYLGIGNSQGLFEGLENYLMPSLEGVALEPGQGLMRALFAWIMGQVGGGSIISSGLRPGDPRDHGRGLAIDISPGSDAIASLAARLIGGPAGWGAGGGVLTTPHGQVLWKTMVGGDHFNHVHFALRSISDFLRGISTSSSGAWATVADVFSKGGLGGGQLAPLRELLMRESGMNPQAQNSSSGAWGLFQFLGSNMGRYLPGGKSSSIAQQAQGGLKYIRERYGTPSAALAFHNAHSWYKGGGEVSATLHTGERVLTMRQNRWFTGIAGPLSALTNAGNVGRLPIELKVAMPSGTTFKITNLKEGIIEVVDDGIYKHVEKTIAIDEWVSK